MRKPYNWCCKVCDAVNEGAGHVCHACGNPANLSPLNADFLRRERTGAPHPPAELRELRFQQALDRLPAWKRAIAYLCMIPVVFLFAMLKAAIFSVWTFYAFLGSLSSCFLLEWIMGDDPPTQDKEP